MVSRSGQPRHIKFWKYFKEWYETYKYGSVAGVTYEKYKLVGRKLQELAPDLVLCDITRFDIQSLVNRYGETHEIQTTRDFYQHIASSLQDAVYEGWIQRDPCYKIAIHSMVKREKRQKWLEADEVNKLEKELAKDTTGYGDFFDFLLRTGLRFAEALGITPKDVDPQKMTIYINKTMNYKDKNGNLKYGDFMPTKNKYSVRIIPIDYKALIDLQKHLGGVAENESIVQHWYNHYKLSAEQLNMGETARLFNSTFNKELEKFCALAGIHTITVHGLRHTHASLLIANGVSIQSVAKRLGHGNTETTQRVYIHLLDELALKDDNKIMSVMAQL